MKNNFDKSAYMTVSGKKTPLPFTYTINNIPLQHASKLKYLGVTITNNLNWNEHIDNICGSAQRKLGLLRRKLKDATPEVKLKAYQSIIRPTLEYAGIVWDPHQVGLINKLERTQRLAARFIFGAYRRTQSVSALLSRAGLPELSARRKIARLKFLYQLYNNKFNLDSRLYLYPPGRVSPRTGHSHAVMPYVPRVDVFKFSFLVKTIVEWNNLDADVFIDTPTTESFERKLSLCIL